MSNTRAMRIKANAEEYDQKFSDIKRLVGALERFASKAVLSSTVRLTLSDSIEATTDIAADLRAEARYKYDSRGGKVKFQLWNGDILMERDSQFDLHIVRHLHDNLDMLIELVENVCEDAGCLTQFRALMARFE